GAAFLRRHPDHRLGGGHLPRVAHGPVCHPGRHRACAVGRHDGAPADAAAVGVLFAGAFVDSVDGLGDVPLHDRCVDAVPCIDVVRCIQVVCSPHNVWSTHNVCGIYAVGCSYVVCSHVVCITHAA